MALALKATRSAGTDVPLNPDEFNRLYSESDLNTLFTGLKDDSIKLSQWQKVQMPDGKKKTKIVETTFGKVDFISKIKQQVVEFLSHVHRVKEQYKALNNLKENLPEGHVIIQMDFAENFICNSADEVQSAYWNSTAVTLRPVVFYYKKDECLRHQNLVFVSDDLVHNIGSVFGILKKLVPEIQSVVGEVKTVHYWTDSPSSQYRNKTSFFIVSDHDALFGMPACWIFFESGHGKGPCDGIGGTAKRMADQAIKQEKFAIQDAKDFYEHVQTLHRSANYVFMSSNEAENARTETNEMSKNLVPVKGTLQIHYVFGVSKGLVKTRVTSCYCETCLENQPHDFNVASLIEVHMSNTNIEADERVGESMNQKRDEGRNVLSLEENRQEKEQDIEGNQMEEDKIDLKEGELIAVTYDGRWYVGRIESVDETDGEFEVKFLRQTKGREESKLMFKWPAQEDILDVAMNDVLCKITPPIPCGRSGRNFELNHEDYKRVLQRYSSI